MQIIISYQCFRIISVFSSILQHRNKGELWYGMGNIGCFVRFGTIRTILNT